MLINPPASLRHIPFKTEGSEIAVQEWAQAVITPVGGKVLPTLLEKLR